MAAKSKILYFLTDSLLILPLLLAALFSRLFNRKIAVGLGPEPLINNIYHKKSLEREGYSAETFVDSVYYITDQFDIRADRILKGLLSPLRKYYLFLLTVFRYRCLYFYFNGGPLGATCFAWRLEAFLYSAANVKTVVMPYGSDLQAMNRTPNNLFKNAMAQDYKFQKYNRNKVQRRIDYWTKNAGHIISGCDWVDYMYYWDTLMLAHFSIDTDDCVPINGRSGAYDNFTILHAPNHRNIKGTGYFELAVESLKKEGLKINLVIVEKMPNNELKKMITSSDAVADQLIIGWYAMFAIEAMSMEKPVICYIRPDLEQLYIDTDLLKENELPVINASVSTVKEKIRWMYNNRDELKLIGKRSREFVINHHSLDYIGRVFAVINNKLGIKK